MSKKINIKFVNEMGLDFLYPPAPTSKMLPEWYKKTQPYIDGLKVPVYDVNSTTNAKIKRCLPVFDILTAGYFILTPADIYVSHEENSDIPFYRWAGGEGIGFHPVIQAELHPQQNGFPYPKWINKWIIKTEPGYSALILSPVHRDLPFETLPGLVDTDNYYGSINFPFILKDPKWQGLIPAGTPIAQIVPFKRESYEMSIAPLESKEHQKTMKMLTFHFADVYRKFFWAKKKEYN
jgi:hypothetical protein